MDLDKVIQEEQLQTARLRLTFITENDYERIHALHSIPEVDRYNTLGIPVSLEETIKLMEPHVADNRTRRNYCFGVYLQLNNTFIGLLGIKMGRSKYQSAEIWFKFNPAVWGEGYATETVTIALKICFNRLNLHRVEAGCAVDNVASYKVMEKVGMKREGQRRQTLPLESGWSDNYEYAILASEFNSMEC